ncbi:MAG: hypothetical protein BYD32DRAFT_464815 [Podila humilis]|nr:MAG: hypothetical protein BYD32DRAFT_464815 [Podila humilis]
MNSTGATSTTHYTDGMQYKAPPVLQHANAVSLSVPAKKHEIDLQAIRDCPMIETTPYFLSKDKN